MAKATDLRKGMAIRRDGDVAVVLDTAHRTPGNYHACVQVKLRSIRTGKSADVRYNSSDAVDVVPMMNTKMEYSYFDGTDYVFSDPDTFETVSVTPDIVGDAKDYMVENSSVNVTLIEDRVVIVEVPSSVVLAVSDAPEGVKGDSANNVQKTITLETGINIQAPLFIKNGDKVKVDTRNGKYMERVNS